MANVIIAVAVVGEELPRRPKRECLRQEPAEVRGLGLKGSPTGTCPLSVLVWFLLWTGAGSRGWWGPIPLSGC